MNFNIVKKIKIKLASRFIPHTTGEAEGSVKTLRSPLSEELMMHCVLSGGTQRRAVP